MKSSGSRRARSKEQMLTLFDQAGRLRDAYANLFDISISCIDAYYSFLIPSASSSADDDSDSDDDSDDGD